MKTITWTLAIVVGLLLAASSAEAQTINACVKQTSGRVRIVGVPGQCNFTETAISWNITGPQGPQGPAGQATCSSGSAPRELVGLTTLSYQGGETLPGFNAHCDSDFPGSRMCFLEEAVNTVDAPLGLTRLAWVRVSPTNTPGFNNCSGWRTTSRGATAMTFDPAAAVGIAKVCDGFRFVACCAPAP